MKRYIPFYLLLALLFGMNLQSCNKDNETSVTPTDYSVYSSATTLVSSFSLMANTKVASHLDSVRFTIDQERGVIYNADSLPLGTKVSALCVNVTCATTVASKQFIVKGGSIQNDTTINYTSTTTDSIDFTGDVILRITSYDKEHVRDYKVKVNVHKQASDSIVWNISRRRDLPNVSSMLKASKTVLQNSNLFLCLVNDNDSYVLSQSEDPMAGTWSKTVLSLPFEPQIKSFAATTSALYILDVNGELFKSTDSGATWTDCGVAWNALIGGYGDRVLGVKQDGSGWKHDEYPRVEGFESNDVADDFPVSGMSELVMANNEWTDSQQAMIMGGVLANGTLTNAIWGYDGTCWGRISQEGSSQVLPALSEAVLVPYYTYVMMSNGYIPQKRVTWMVMGGKKADGKLNTINYISYNQGVNWQTGDSGVQKPSHIPAFYGAQAYTYNRTLQNNSSSSLKAYDPGQITPITQWECPYIYLFGGYDSNGVALNSLWEGVLTGLTHKPVF